MRLKSKGKVCLVEDQYPNEYHGHLIVPTDFSQSCKIFYLFIFFFNFFFFWITHVFNINKNISVHFDIRVCVCIYEISLAL